MTQYWDYDRYYKRDRYGWEDKLEEAGVNRCQFCGGDGGEDSICGNCRRDDYTDYQRKNYSIAVSIRGRRTR